MKSITASIRYLTVILLWASADGIVNAQLAEIPGMTQPHTVIDFDDLTLGGVTTQQIISQYPGVNLSQISVVTRSGQGNYNFQNGDGNGLAALDLAGNLGIISPAGGPFQNMDSLDVSFITGVTEFGFGIGDWSGPFNIFAFDGMTQVGSFQVDLTSNNTIHYIESAGPAFDRVQLTTFPDFTFSNWVLTALFIPGQSDDPTEVTEITDVGAINSLLKTGLLIPAVQRSAVISASRAAIGDLNNRLFRARASQGSEDEADFQSSLDAPFIRFLDFTQRQVASISGMSRIGEGVEVAAGATIHESEATGRSLIIGSPLFLGDKEVAGGSKEVFESSNTLEWEVFTEADFGFYDQDNLNALVRGFETDTYAGSVGVEHRILDWLHIGAAVTRLESDTNLEGNLGGVDLSGTILSGYFTAFFDQIYFDALYSFGSLDNDVSRNTLLGSTAQGATKSQSHNLDVNLGYNYQLSDQVSAGPFAGLNYALGHIDGYTEFGGGRANLVYPDDDFESFVGRLGWQISVSDQVPAGRLTVQGSIAWAHENMPDSGNVQAGLSTSPFSLVTGSNVQSVGGFTASSPSASAGTDWVELGCSVTLNCSNQWNLSLNYEGQYFRDSASGHFVGAKLGYEW